MANRLTVTERHMDMYEDFKRYFGATDDSVKYWRPGVGNELVVYLENGRVVSYNTIYKTFMYIDTYEVDERGDYALNDSEYKLAFSRKLRRIMDGRLMNQARLSQASGISSVSLSHYMNGRSLPDLRNANRLCRALECTLSDLTEFE